MSNRSWLRELLEAALIGLLVFVVIQVALVNFRVEGQSMLPTLEPGYYLMVDKITYSRVDTARLGAIIPFWRPQSPRHIYLARSPARGDVIVFDYPNDPTRQFVKRIIGIPGDTVAIRDGRVIVNDVPLAEPYIVARSSDRLSPRSLDAGQYFVLGDNRSGSRDSRHWGALDDEYIIGKVWAIYWPRSAWGFPK